jgi:hypothetical protein
LWALEPDAMALALKPTFDCNDIGWNIAAIYVASRSIGNSMPARAGANDTGRFIRRGIESLHIKNTVHRMYP